MARKKLSEPMKNGLRTVGNGRVKWGGRGAPRFFNNFLTQPNTLYALQERGLIELSGKKDRYCRHRVKLTSDGRKVLKQLDRRQPSSMPADRGEPSALPKMKLSVVMREGLRVVALGQITKGIARFHGSAIVGSNTFLALQNRGLIEWRGEHDAKGRRKVTLTEAGLQEHERRNA